MPVSLADPRLEQLTLWLASLPSDLRSRLQLSADNLEPASSDASTRRYFRLASATAERGALIAMDAPPPEKCREFVNIAKLMDDAGMRVPHVYAADLERGFMLLSDLGREVYIDVLTPDNRQALMLAALATLTDWQLASRPDVLPVYDAAFLRRELDLFPEWYLGHHLDRRPEDQRADPASRAALEPVFDLLIRSALAQPQVFMHRDFMPRNLMADMAAMTDSHMPKPGVLDFQDAVYGPIGYDVISLFRDALISWDEDFELDCLVRYWERARKLGLPVRSDFAEFYRELEWMGLQRHLKILGLFARLWYRDGKPRYLADTPRFIGYASKVARRYRELAPLARLLDSIEDRVAEVGYTF